MIGKNNLHHFGNKQLKGRYANNCQVGFNRIEFVFDFGQSFNSIECDQYHTRIITSPFYLKLFFKTLNNSIIDYENKYGAINELNDD